MSTVTSKDGTTIAYDQAGAGPALILVGGMFEQRAMASETAQLAALPLLREHFSVVHYDRRGRGESGDTAPYAGAREIEDVEALIDAAGGAALLFGISSGAALALEAALALGGKVRRLALYEPPYNDDDEARRTWRGFRRELGERLAEGRNGEAVATVMRLFGVPDEQLDAMRELPMWPMWEAIAPTIAYDATVLGDEARVPAARAAGITVPTLVVDGEASYPFMQVTARALAGAIPGARHVTLPGQTHEVSAEALAPVLVEFFSAVAEPAALARS